MASAGHNFPNPTAKEDSSAQEDSSPDPVGEWLAVASGFDMLEMFSLGILEDRCLSPTSVCKSEYLFRGRLNDEYCCV